MKILINNRGECALRIIRAAKLLGYSTIAVYAKGDEKQLHLNDADETICIGEATASNSYLNIERVIAAAKITKADAIHPGYGFLSESHRMATATEAANLKWIGPSSKSMCLLSNKQQGRQIAQQAGMKIISGSDACSQSENLRQIADKIGYPVMLKAASGGGGKGMRVITQASQWHELFAESKQEAIRAYGSDAFIIEQYLHQPKHIEAQVLVTADHQIHILGYRDCSIQKRHQKIIEESYFPPHHGIDTQEIESQIKSMLQSIHYQGLGTLEFLVLNKQWYFIEINTRMQVEHTVTECQTNLDLIQYQILTGLGETFPLHAPTKMHAIECRINLNSFRHGNQVQGLRWPGGCNVRIDSHLYSGYTIPSHYDAMLAKIICYDHERASAIKRMQIALSECTIGNIDHNIPCLRETLQLPSFQNGTHHTQTETIDNSN